LRISNTVLVLLNWQVVALAADPLGRVVGDQPRVVTGLLDRRLAVMVGA
jgi:hypothetical protein